MPFHILPEENVLMAQDFTLRSILRWVLAVFYFVAGILHLFAPDGFVRIVPQFVPLPDVVVMVTGVLELAGAIGLMVTKLRHAAGIGLAAYAVCVFPANINHAVNMISIGGLPNSWWYHAPRLAFQPVLVWWAFYVARD